MVDKINVKSLQQQSLRSNIGVVAQDTVLFHARLVLLLYAFDSLLGRA